MVDEDVSRRTIAVYVKASKLTARALAYALGAVGRKIAKEHRKAQAPQGKQSARKLLRQAGDTSGMDLPGDTRQFDRVARRWGVDYAIRPGLCGLRAGATSSELTGGFVPQGRRAYCSEACSRAARRKRQRGYMRKNRG